GRWLRGPRRPGLRGGAAGALIAEGGLAGQGAAAPGVARLGDGGGLVAPPLALGPQFAVLGPQRVAALEQGPDQDPSGRLGLLDALQDPLRFRRGGFHARPPEPRRIILGRNRPGKSPQGREALSTPGSNQPRPKLRPGPGGGIGSDGAAPCRT